MKQEFYKYHGAGNDFVIIDNRDLKFDDKNVDLVAHLCHRRFGVGADGLMLLQNHDKYDFEMRYYNADGKEASMCGNGGRCIVAFAYKLGIISTETSFLAVDGVHKAKVCSNEEIDLQMTDVCKIDTYNDGFFLDTGSPHFVQFTDNLENIDVNKEGRTLRFDQRFQPAGTNVDFVKQNGMNLTVYTFERGVEFETLACGTGITASALATAYKDKNSKGTYKVTAKGGHLEVRFTQNVDQTFSDIWLKGPAKLVFKGNFED